MTTTIDDYFLPGWRQATHACPACQWSGDSRQMEMELFDEQTEYSCPQCELPLLLVVHPDLAQIRQAAAAGHPEAIEQLQMLEAFGRRG